MEGLSDIAGRDMRTRWATARDGHLPKSSSMKPFGGQKPAGAQSVLTVTYVSGPGPDFTGRSDRIRTYDPLTPSQVRYQTAPRSDRPHYSERAVSLQIQTRRNFETCGPRFSGLDPECACIRQVRRALREASQPRRHQERNRRGGAPRACSFDAA